MLQLDYTKWSHTLEPAFEQLGTKKKFKVLFKAINFECTKFEEFFSRNHMICSYQMTPCYNDIYFLRSVPLNLVILQASTPYIKFMYANY